MAENSFLPDKLQGINNLKVFVVEETEAGTILWPLGTDAIYVTGAPGHNQQPSFSDSKEVADTLSKIKRFTDMTPEGSWDLSMMARIAAAGSVPMGAPLWKAAFGAVTISAGVKAVYGLTEAKTSLTILIIEGENSYLLRGATVNGFGGGITGKGGLELKFSGGFMEKLWAGTVVFAAGMTYTAATKKIVLPTGLNDYKKYCAKTRIRIWDASASAYLTDGTNAYFDIVSSNAVDNSLVLGAAITGTWTPEAGDRIEPWCPTPVYGTTYGLQCRDSRLCIGGVASGNEIAVTGADWSLDNGIKYLSDEVTSAKTPKAYVPGQRSVGVKAKMYLRRDDLKYFYDGFNNVAMALYIEAVADAAAANPRQLALQIAFPYMRGSVPALSGDRPRQIDIDFTAFASAAGEDEMSATCGNIAA